MIPLAAGDEKPAEKKWAEDRSLTVSPKAAPVPALKYRLYPLASERKDGNAVPMYLRFAHERGDAAKKSLYENTKKYNELPLDKLPLAEGRKFLDTWRLNLRQMELGARRKTADWAYALDAGNPVELLLPDIQEMRMHAALLQLKARVEIAEGKYDEAARTLATGFSFSQQLSEAPFLINGLVGLACASKFTDCLLDLVERPDAPNLYWSMTALPRPLIDLRRALEMEQRLLEMIFPELTDLSRERTPEQWDALLAKIRAEMVRVEKLEGGAKPDHFSPDPAEPAAKSKQLEAARRYLRDRGATEADVKAMPPARVLLLASYGMHKEMRDDVFKASYLPYAEARPVMVAAEKSLRDEPKSELTWPSHMLLPAIAKVHRAQAVRERGIAALRVIEAVRLHAAANGGAVPDKLAEIKAVPMPDDPVSGKPFEYARDGRTFTITSRVPGEDEDKGGLRLRVTMR